MTRVAAYIRVSTQEQKLHGISLDAQRDKLKEYADKHNLNIINWYEDEGISGRKLIKNRPALQRMLNDSQKGLFERIIFIKLDRFFRSVAEYHECMKLLGDITWTATEEKYDLTTANGRAFVNMKLTIAELEADQTGERIKLVNEYKVKSGQPVTGSIAWSHKIVSTDNGKRVIINPETREQALDVINYYITTNSLRKTLLYCNQYHSFYDIYGLKRWLSSTLLIGVYRDNNNYCEPLITPETFNLLQEKLANNIRYSSVGEPLFRRLLICPDCGKRLTAATNCRVINGKRYRYQKYRCDNYRRKRCSNNRIYSENMIERVLLDNLATELDNYIVRINNIESGTVVPVVNTASIKQELERINYMFEKGRLSLQEYDSKYEALQKELDRADNTATDPVDISHYKSLLESNWRDLYNALSTENKGNFWHKILKEIYINKNGYDYSIDHLNFV